MRLSASDRQRIHAAAEAAEARCGVHISVAIVKASDRYALYPIVWGALVALTAGGIITLFLPHLTGRSVFAIEAAGFVALSLLLDWWPLRVRCVPRRIRHARASVFAHREFAARILAERRDAGGVLVFLSLGERYAEVLADRQAHAGRDNTVWEKTVAAVVAAATSGQVADGIVSALRELEAALARG